MLLDALLSNEQNKAALVRLGADGRLPHAIILEGERGSGRFTLARLISAMAVCRRSGAGCGECPDCKMALEGQHPDVEVFAKSGGQGTLTIKCLRTINQSVATPPNQGRRRVVILRDIQDIAQARTLNTLLKVIEEPPEYLMFIITVDNRENLLPTILSRCQRFDFHRIRSRVIADRLLYIAEQESFSLADDAALLIARLSDGGMRDALSLLDLCASFGTDITVQAVTQAAGLAGQSHLFEIADAAIARDPAAALLVGWRLSEQSCDFPRLCEQMIGHYRNLMIVKTVREADDLVQGTPEDLERLRTQAGGISLGAIMYALGVLQDAATSLTRTAFKRTELEMAIVRLCDERMGGGLEGVLDRLEKLEKAARLGAAQAPAAPPAQPEASGAATAPPKDSAKPVSAAAASKPKPAAGVAQVTPFGDWARVLEELAKINAALRGAMNDSRAFVHGEMMLIDCQNELFRSLVRTSIAAKESLRDAILAVTGHKYNLGPYNPDKYAPAAAPSDPLEGMLKRASELDVPVELK